MEENSTDHTSSGKERSIQRGHCGDLRTSTTPAKSDRGQVSSAAKDPRQSNEASKKKGRRNRRRQRDTDMDGKKIVSTEDGTRIEQFGTSSRSLSLLSWSLCFSLPSSCEACWINRHLILRLMKFRATKHVGHLDYEDLRKHPCQTLGNL